MVEKKKKKKFTFLLKNIDLDTIERKYGIVIVSNIDSKKSNLKNTTNILDLASNEDKKYFSYLDESKKEHKCLFTMYDRLFGNLKDTTNTKCFWCRNDFTTIPIGCPIKYIPSQLVKTYYSEITKDKYIIRENISKQKTDKVENILKNKNDKKINIRKKDYYETDGLFCSFNCCLAFIEDNSHIPLYIDSKMLLSKMFYGLFDTKEEIIKASSWRLLKDYGGNYTIEEFRNNFNKVEYTDISNIVKNLPSCKSVGFLYEEKIKF